MDKITHEGQMKAMLHNALGCFSRECCEIYWNHYQETQLKTQLTNVYLKYA